MEKVFATNCLDKPTAERSLFLEDRVNLPTTRTGRWEASSRSLGVLVLASDRNITDVRGDKADSIRLKAPETYVIELAAFGSRCNCHTWILSAHAHLVRKAV